MEDIYQFIYESDWTYLQWMIFFGLGFEAGKLYLKIKARIAIAYLLKNGLIQIEKGRKERGL